MSVESKAKHDELMGELFGGEEDPGHEFIEPKPVEAPKPVAVFCWACGTNHTDEDICIPRSE